MSLLMRGPDGRLYPVNPGLARHKGNQGGMGKIITEADVMSRLPDADIVGAIGPGVVPGGEQAVGARRGQLAQEGATPPAPTYRPLGGAQQNNRGNAQIVNVGGSLGTPVQNIASVVETGKNSGDDAEVITVQLSMELPPQLSEPTDAYASLIIDVVAIVEWGVGNAFYRAEVDWNQGVSFCVSASFVRVSARVAETPAGVFADPALPIVLRASLAYGNANTLNTSSAARRTLEVGSGLPSTLGPGVVSAAFPIPLWAMGCTLVDGGSTASFTVAPDYTIGIMDGAVGNMVAAYQVTSRSNQARQIEGQFPIPSKGRFIFVQNNLGVTMVAPKLIFNLGF